MSLTIEELKVLIQNDEHRLLELKKTTGELKDAPMAVSGQDDAAKAQWFPLSAFLDKPSGRSSFAGLLPTGRKKAERPELAFDHEEIIRDAIKKYKDVVR